MGKASALFLAAALLFGGAGTGEGPAAARGAARQGLPGVKSLPEREARPVAPGSEPGSDAAPAQPQPQGAGAFRSRAEHWRHFLERWHFVSVFDVQARVNHARFVRCFLSTFAPCFPRGGAPAIPTSEATAHARIAEDPARAGAPPLNLLRVLDAFRKGSDPFPGSGLRSGAYGGGGLPGIGPGAPPFYYLFMDPAGAWLPPPADLPPGRVYTLAAGAKAAR